MSKALPLRAASSSASRSRRLRSMDPPRFLVRVVTLVVWPVSKPATVMDFWNSTHVSCWVLPDGLILGDEDDSVGLFDLEEKCRDGVVVVMELLLV